MASILEYAQLCEAVYDDNPSMTGWARKAFRPTASGLHDAFQGAAFQKGTELVFCFKGTDNKRDVAADLKLGVGMNTSHFGDATDFVNGTDIESAGQVTLCGHSLGGAIAQIVGNRLRQRFVTFNAPGIALMSRNLDQMAVAATTGTMYLRIAGAAVSTLRHPVQAARDVGSMFYTVSGVNFRLGKDVVGSWGVHYGKVVEIAYSGGAMDVKSKHLIGTFISELKAKGYGNISLAGLL